MNNTLQPDIILVRPQMPENIGAAARAMANFGLQRLKIVAPREKFPCEISLRMASHADNIIHNAQVFDNLQQAAKTLQRLYATTARPRDMVKMVTTPEYACTEMRGAINGGIRCGIMFGPERTGLENNEVAMADVIISIPTNPDFSSLNLAQSVVITGYEWMKSELTETSAYTLDLGRSTPARKGEIENFFQHLEFELAESNFFKSPQKRPGMMLNIRNCLQRANFTDQDIRTLRGMVRALAHKY